MKILTTAILYIFIPAMLLAAPIEDFTAKYNVYHNEMYVGQSTRSLNSNSSLLKFSSVTETAGLAALFFDITINETSQLILKNKNLNFFSYHYNENKEDKNKHYQLSIDDKTQQLYNSHTRKHYPTTKNMHDMLGFTIAIMFDLKKGLRDLKYSIAEKNKINNYHLKFIQEEKLISNNKEINTLKMEHYDPLKKQRFTLWCAKNLDFVPLRIRKIKENGDETLLNLTQFNHENIYLSLDNEESD